MVSREVPVAGVTMAATFPQGPWSCTSATSTSSTLTSLCTQVTPYRSKIYTRNKRWYVCVVRFWNSLVRGAWNSILSPGIFEWSNINYRLWVWSKALPKQIIEFSEIQHTLEMYYFTDTCHMMTQRWSSMWIWRANVCKEMLCALSACPCCVASRCDHSGWQLSCSTTRGTNDAET